jgi:hypothetical protein
MLRKLTIQYFSAFASKDLSYLRDAFSDDVSLRDWNLTAFGVVDVLQANATIFESLDGIRVEVLNVFESGATVIAEISIAAENLEPIKVVDILTFNPSGKIISVRAYRG